MPIAPLQLPSSTLNVPQIDFTPLSQLGEVYKKGQERQMLSDIGKGLADGTLDYKQAAGQIAGTGNLSATYQFLQLAEAKEKLQRETAAGSNFASRVGGWFAGGGDAAAAAPAAQPSMALPPSSASPIQPPQAAPGTVPQVPAPQPMSRAPVASSPRVWGDQEAVDAGLYEPGPGKASPLSLASLGTGGAGVPAPVGSASTGSIVPATPQGMPQPQRTAQAAPAVAAPAVAAPTASKSGLPQIGVAQIPMLLEAMANPNMPAGHKEIAGKLFTRALDDAKPNEKIQYLQQLKESSGFQGTPLELEMQLRRASKTDVTTNIDQKTESEENKAAGKGAGERRATMFASAGAASKTLASLSRTESLLNQVEQGKLSPARMSISAWAKALGMNDDIATSLGLDPKGVGSAQALAALTNEAVIGKIGAGGFPSNNFSDADREFLMGTVQKIGNDPRANKIITETGRRMAQLDIERAKAYQAFKKDPANAKRGFEDFELDYSDKISKQDMFSDLRKQAEAIVGGPRNDIGGTLNNPGAAPPRQQQQPRQQGGNVTPNGIGWSLN
jgi:hypothetical protein